MKRISSALTVVLILLGATAAATADSSDAVIRDLNRTRSVVGSEDIKSYTILFDAYLDLTPPPMPIGPELNLTTIYPGMTRWDEVSGWAESNGEMADAIVRCEKEGKTLFGLPYGRSEVRAVYDDNDLVADIGVGGTMRTNLFPWLDAMDTIAAFATAEAYRRLEAGRMQDAGDLVTATCFILRQTCDREFKDEVIHSVELLTAMLENLRDMMWLYEDEISPDQYREIAMFKLPFLRPDRARLLIPEGDRRVAEALLDEVFDDRGQADRDAFAEAFASIQSADAPLTRFGAARRWRQIADIHDSKTSSLERLTLIYDDWWRRWRVEEYDPILGVATQFERTNPVRLAAVVYSMQDLEQLFAARNGLIAAVHGTSMAAGLCGYDRYYGNYPATSDMMYSQFVRQRSDRDPFDQDFLPFKYRVLDAPFTVQSAAGRVQLEPGQAILYSRGDDLSDDRGGNHSSEGESGSDIVMWPPIRAMARQGG